MPRSPPGGHPLKFIFRWLFRLFLVAVVLAIAAALLKDAIVKEIMQSRIRSVSGMEARIGKVDLGILTPTLTIEDLKLYNTPEFGGSLFLDMPELHIEYDPVALRAGQLRLTLLRLNLAETDVVQDKQGRLNYLEFEKRGATAAATAGHSGGAVKFAGIDTLNLSIGRLRYTDLGAHSERVINFGVKDQIFHNVKSDADLARLGVSLAAQSAANAPAANSGLSMGQLMKALLGP